MPRRFACCLLLALAHATALAQAPTVLERGAVDRSLIQRDTRDVDERSLLQLEDRWAAAVVQRDRNFFDRTLAPRFVHSEDDRLIPRDAPVRDRLTGTDTVTAAQKDGMKVYGYGETAVVTGWLTMRGRGPAGPFDRRYRFTDTWVRLDNRWQIVAAHEYLVPARKTP